MPPFSPDDERALQEVLGYLNFAAGKPDAKFQRHLNQFWTRVQADHPWQQVRTQLTDALDELRRTSPAFQNSDQAARVLELGFDHVLAAYRKHHVDLLFHLPEEAFQNPLFLARIFEAVLEQGPPWNETERITLGAVRQLNDFLGHRPVAVLESGQQMQPYDHEKFRPLPLFIAGAGPASGPHAELISRTMEHLERTPAEMRADAHFYLEQLEELSLDPRAYDHQHPMYKRTNYMFGEWDPHRMDSKGRYTRFVIRVIILEALADWMKAVAKLPYEEVMYEASAVLCGTILMASTISGAGPHTYDSTVSLGTLLSKVARQRDAYYTRLLKSLTGSFGQRLMREAEQVKQPFGKVRQHLNLFIAHHGLRQVQHSHLAYLYARMGYPEAARSQAGVIPAASIRFECEMEWRITAAHGRLDRDEFPQAAALVAETENLLHRGIGCGALADPWSILGFQGNFPLFHAREDAVADPRVERLLGLMEQIFGLYARLLSAAAAEGRTTIREEAVRSFRELANFWDKFATSTVSGLPQVNGGDSFESSVHVADALAEWRAAGEAAGDVSFWRQHVDRFQSPKAYVLVLESLLRKQDSVASMGLLIQWLNQADAESVELESGAFSFHQLLLRWLRLALREESAGTSQPDAAPSVNWARVVKLFDYLEANAGEFWNVPDLGRSLDRPAPDIDDEGELPEAAGEDEEEDSIFSAAYEDVVFRDSAADGNIGDTVESAATVYDTDLDLLIERLEPRLKFLVTLSRLWQSTAQAVADLCARPAAGTPAPGVVMIQEALPRWYDRAVALQRELQQLIQELWQLHIPKPSGDQDSLLEYDRQLQLKFGLVSNIVFTHVACHEASWNLAGCLDATRTRRLPDWEQQTVELFRAVLRREPAAVRKLLPELLGTLAERPLLYVPLDKGGDPQQLLATRTLQSVIRALTAELPRLGMFRETWHLLKTAQQMERISLGTGGTVITEFDRLFHAAFRNSLQGVIRQTEHWEGPPLAGQELIDIVETLTESYLDVWLEHSSTMRLSSLEMLSDKQIWRELREFIQAYGQDFFHAQMLTLGNLRAILHNGVDAYLDFLEQNADPLRPIKLFDDIAEGRTDRWSAATHLETVFRATVEKFDRFLEYNTTTTQSDYGEQFYVFLDFLRLEASYERQAWNLAPLVTAHEVLVRAGKDEPARIWREVFSTRTAEAAKHHLQWLKKLEKKYGMKLPSITDLLSERFVKPLSLDGIIALVAPAVQDSRKRQDSGAFSRLQREVERYLHTTTGSGLDVPPWLRSLEGELHQVLETDSRPPDEEWTDVGPRDLLAQELLAHISPDDLQQQFNEWEAPLGGGDRKKKKRKN